MQNLPELDTTIAPRASKAPCGASIDQANPVASARIVAHADGSCLGNPGPGGWAYAIVHADGTRQTSSGAIKRTTNIVAEIMAATEALRAMPEDAIGTLSLDSDYLVRAANEWRWKWQNNGWRASSGSLVANTELLKALFALLDARPGVKLKWIRGHAGGKMNGLVDMMARTEAERAQYGYGLR